jgi:hypothetical protein
MCYDDDLALDVVLGDDLALDVVLDDGVVLDIDAALDDD